jgi:hypothetical protein
MCCSNTVRLECGRDNSLCQRLQYNNASLSFRYPVWSASDLRNLCRYRVLEPFLIIQISVVNSLSVAGRYMWRRSCLMSFGVHGRNSVSTWGENKSYNKSLWWLRESASKGWKAVHFLAAIALQHLCKWDMSMMPPTTTSKDSRSKDDAVNGNRFMRYCEPPSVASNW